MASLFGKVVIITGAGSGIGAATAMHFAKHSPKLVLVDRRLKKLQEVSEECKADGLSSENIMIHTCDVTKEGDLKDLMERSIDNFTKIDVLVNNAGIGFYGNILDIPMETFDNIMATNVRAPFYLSRLCLPYLKKTQGSIINVSSIWGEMASPMAIPYCISKAGLDHFTRALALEMAPHKVRVNSVNPGVVITDFQKSAGMVTEENYQDYLDKQTELQPLTGALDAVEVSKAIKYFASDESSSITGELLFVDGGRHCKAPV